MFIGICDSNRTSYSLARSVVIDACVQADIDAKLITFFRAKSIASMPEQSGELTLVLINADMADCDPFDVARCLYRSNPVCLIAFYSHYSKNMEKAFPCRASAFFFPMEERAAFLCLVRGLIAQILSERRVLTLESKREILRLPISSIEYCESCCREVHIHTTGSGEHHILQQLDRLEQLLSCGRFIRCHQSYLVNYDCILKIDKSLRKISLASGAQVPISKAAYAGALESFANYAVSETKNE